MYTTERLHLRALHPSDEQAITALWANPLIFINEPESATTAGQAFMRSFITFTENGVFGCVIEERAGGAFVGIAALLPMDAKNRTTQLGIAVLPAFWAKGYVSETARFVAKIGFEQLGLHRIEAPVMSVSEYFQGQYREACVELCFFALFYLI